MGICAIIGPIVYLSVLSFTVRHNDSLHLPGLPILIAALGFVIVAFSSENRMRRIMSFVDANCEAGGAGDAVNDCWQIMLHFGFKDEPDVPRALQLLQKHGVQIDDMETSYFLSRDIVIPTIGGGMAPWREKLFAQMHHNASGAADFLNLPNNSVVELGSKIEI